MTYSGLGNPFLFTGRLTDTLGADALEAASDPDGFRRVQDNRNRIYDPAHGRWLQRDPLGVRPDPPAGALEPVKQYTDGMSVYEYVRNNPVNRQDWAGLTTGCYCGPDITNAIAEHLNDFVGQAQRDLSWFWPWGASTLQSYARQNGHAGPLGTAVNAVKGCGTGPCAGTATLCDMCISQYHMDHILIMVYIAESYSVKTARSAGQYNESFWLGSWIEGTVTCPRFMYQLL